MKVLYDECIESLKDNKCSECNDFYQCLICDYFQERYNKGRADMKNEIEKHSVFYSNRPIEELVLEARNDAIEKFKQTLIEIGFSRLDGKVSSKEIEFYAEQLKEN